MSADQKKLYHKGPPFDSLTLRAGYGIQRKAKNLSEHASGSVSSVLISGKFLQSV